MKKIVFMAFLFVATAGFAQDMDVTKGDFKFLSGQKELNVEFNYSNLKLLKENVTNDKYIADRTEDLNKKSKGNGDAWKKRWNSSPEMIWNPKFMELLGKTYANEKDVTVQEGLTTAKYTLVVDVVWIYPGYDVAIMKQPAKVNTVLRFVETANRNNVLLEIKSDEAPGNQMGNQFNNETRIGEGFAKTAKSLGKMIVKKMK